MNRIVGIGLIGIVGLVSLGFALKPEKIEANSILEKASDNTISWIDGECHRWVDDEEGYAWHESMHEANHNGRQNNSRNGHCRRNR